MFKIALGSSVQSETSRCLGARDYGTLFNVLLREPLKHVDLVGPIFVVIDALDESNDANGKDGLHSFLADHMPELPANFRILITSRPEKDIQDVFQRPPFHIMYMNDAELAASTDDDILAYVEDKLPPNLAHMYSTQLVQKRRGCSSGQPLPVILLQPPPSGTTSDECVDMLLHDSHNPVTNKLDDLYRTVLQAHFTMIHTPRVSQRFRSVIGQLLAAIDPHP
ncbi:hypothetical protein B0H14DRAFT_3486162 [Mycena olivaceomarginata]|nr:hypothetical protein B0H14DRAFT_3486162 [Mycena olivaceomarginata]